MSPAAKVGAFMLVILAIIGYFVLKIEDLDLGGGETREIQVLFDDVAGLDEGSAVRVAGTRQGKVSRIQLRPAERSGDLTAVLDPVRTERRRQCDRAHGPHDPARDRPTDRQADRN